MKLYSLADNYNQIIDLLEATDDREALQDTLDSLEEAFDDKVESIVKLIRSKEATQYAVKTESDRLGARAFKLGKEIEWLEQYVENQMKRFNKEEVKSSLFSIKFANCPHAVNVLNESAIPVGYFDVKEVRTLDKRFILENLKNGIDVPGCEIIQRKSLRIK